MKRIIFVFVAAAILFPNAAVLAEKEGLFPALGSGDAKSKEPVVINGDVVEYLEAGKTATATGNVSINYEDIILTCDRAIFHVDTKEAVADGNVVLTQGKNYFKGEHLVYNFEAKTGTVLKTKAYIEPSYYGGGEKADRVSEKEYIIERGYVTTCDKEKPHYKIQARQLYVYPGDKVTARNILFFVGDVPILYFPFYSHSLKDKHPGVTIIPGRDKDWGYFVLTSWRYYLNESFKGRIHIDYRERKDIAGGFDLNYRTHNMGNGVLKTYYLPERDMQRKHFWSRWSAPEEDLPTVEKDRYRVQLRHKWQMDPITMGTLELNKMSDASIVKDYYLKDYLREMSSNTYTSIIRTDEYYTTTLLAQKRINRFEEKVEYLPNVKFETRALKIGQTNFYYEGEISGANLTRKFAAPTDDDYDVRRTDTKNELSYQRNLFGWLETRPFVGTQQTWYSKDIDGESNMIRGNFFTGIGLNSRFYRIFDVKSDLFNMEINKLRHVISPTVSYSYSHRPTHSSGEFQQFDEIDSLGFGNAISPSLENKLQTKRMVGDKLESVDLARFIVGTSYNFGFEEKKGGRLSNYSLTFESSPYNWMSILSNSNYNPHANRFESFSFNIAADPELEFSGQMFQERDYANIERKKWSYAGGYRWDNDLGSQIEGDLMFNITPKWKLFTYQRFDLKKFESDPTRPDGRRKVINKLAEQEYRLVRDLHCWVGEFVYNITREHGHTMMFVFRIKAFPSVPIEFEKRFFRPRFGSQLPPS